MKTSRIHNTILSILLIVLVLNLTTGCYYYRVNTKTSMVPEDIRWEDFNQKYMILHDSDSAWHMNKINVDTNALTCDISPLQAEHKSYLHTDPYKTNRYQKNTFEQLALNEVHLYTSEQVGNDDTRVSVDFNSLQKMEIYYFDHRSTNVSHVVPAITIPVALIVIISVIIALTKSSCPYVYILDDNEFKFIGEIYSGAIYPSLERDDYLALPKPSTNDGKYSIKIANKLPEVQYINLSELWFVQHQKNTEVLADRYGTIHTLSAKQQPSGAITSGGSDLMDIISAKDQNCFLFQEEPYTTGDSAAINSIIMTCDVPKETASAKLVVRAKNSYWGDYIFGEFAKLFGNKYDQWIKKRGKEPPDRPLQWKKDQNMVLMVYLETKYGWEFVDYFDMTGPLAFRDMVMPLGLEKAKRTNIDGKEQVRIKIQSGFMFWELDYAALDISGNLPTEKIIIHPTSAMNENGKNVLKLLSIDDERYYIQPSIGNETVLDFDYPSTVKSPEVSFILHSKGYYTHIRAYPGPPDQEQLETFREPGRMSLFSLETFRMEKAKTSAVLNESE